MLDDVKNATIASEDGRPGLLRRRVELVLGVAGLAIGIAVFSWTFDHWTGAKVGGVVDPSLLGLAGFGLLFASAALLMVRHLFPALALGPMPLTMVERLVEAIRASGPGLAFDSARGGRVGDVLILTGWIDAEVYPGGLVVKPVGLPHQIVRADEITSVRRVRWKLGSALEVRHTGAGARSPLVLELARDSDLDSVLREISRPAARRHGDRRAQPASSIGGGPLATVRGASAWIATPWIATLAMPRYMAGAFLSPARFPRLVVVHRLVQCAVAAALVVRGPSVTADFGPFGIAWMTMLGLIVGSNLWALAERR